MPLRGGLAPNVNESYPWVVALKPVFALDWVQLNKADTEAWVSGVLTDHPPPPACPTARRTQNVNRMAL